MYSPGEILNVLATALHGLIRTMPMSVLAQQSAYAIGVLFDLYAFHRSTLNSLCPYRTPDALHPIILDNACILCITMAAGTELANAYSPIPSLLLLCEKNCTNHGPSTSIRHCSVRLSLIA
ncbi:hypothetical protein BC332_02505 [Capsicum chinense]|nr:hypothetical protein BC332_02505 [Capsicum chinense]